MKQNRKLMLSVLVALLMLVVGATTVLAANSEKKLEAGKSVIGDYETYYKITVKKDGMLTISSQNVGDEAGAWMDIYLYAKDKGEYYNLSNVIWTTDKSKTVKYAVAKGTYYLRGNKNSKFKYKFTQEPYKANYCASKATSLKKNKEVTVVNTAKNGYDRWYKIKLTKRQMLTFWKSGSNTDVQIYDSNMEAIDTIQDNDDSTKYYSRTLLKKGTYYVRIAIPSYFNSYNKSVYTTFKWK